MPGARVTRQNRGNREIRDSFVAVALKLEEARRRVRVNSLYDINKFDGEGRIETGRSIRSEPGSKLRDDKVDKVHIYLIIPLGRIPSKPRTCPEYH